MPRIAAEAIVTNVHDNRSVVALAFGDWPEGDFPGAAMGENLSSPSPAPRNEAITIKF